MNPQQVELVERMARDIGAIRWRTEDEVIRWTARRLSGEFWWVLAWQRPTAGELVAEGWDVDAALHHVDEETRRMNRIVGRIDPHRPVR